MTFGFKDKEGAKSTEMKYDLRDTLKLLPWESIVLQLEVQSVFTGNKGVIISVDKPFNQIEISWYNGKNTRAAKEELDKVIVV